MNGFVHSGCGATAFGPLENPMEALGEIAFADAFNTEPVLRLEIAAEEITRFLLERFAPASVSCDTGEPQNEVEEKRYLRLLPCNGF